ncbi:guanine permease [Paenibacillus swuensis]|uniref:Guanine permease n=1 Tax=Paenibacillus swuensis TaxID=1178515 RepID=A0A172TEY8_9BACL|nr:guanine permease [Paenibacillus swuensis]
MNAFNKTFQLGVRGTNVQTEITAGLTTFLTMVYIVVVNPAILSSAGIPFQQVFTATVIAAVVGTLYMAFFANHPIAVAPGMGMNSYFASVVATQGLSYQIVLGTVFIAGLIFLVLSFTRFREVLIEAIPATLKHGITAGIGLFIAFNGLRMSGIIAPSEATLVKLGDLSQPVAMLTIGGLLLILALMVRRVPGALFIGMVVIAVAGLLMGQLDFKGGFASVPSAPVFFDMDLGGVFTNGLYAVVFSFLLVAIFDTTGTMIGVAEQAGLMKDGKLPQAKHALMADALATTVGAAAGTSPSAAYIESSAGVAAGGRTGLTALTVGVLMAATLFFSPAVEAISSLAAITAPALIIVGCFMLAGLARIEWGRMDEAFPAFIVLLMMPLTSSIATGIAVGFITYPLLKLVAGRAREVHPLLYVFGAIFLVQMIFFPAG